MICLTLVSCFKVEVHERKVTSKKITTPAAAAFWQQTEVTSSAKHLRFSKQCHNFVWKDKITFRLCPYSCVKFQPAMRQLGDSGPIPMFKATIWQITIYLNCLFFVIIYFTLLCQMNNEKVISYTEGVQRPSLAKHWLLPPINFIITDWLVAVNKDILANDSVWVIYQCITDISRVWVLEPCQTRYHSDLYFNISTFQHFNITPKQPLEFYS